MVEYKWEILSLYVVPHENGLDNIVESVNWRFQAREDSSFGDVYDVTVLPRPSSDAYVMYETLDEETIIGWVKNQIDYDALVKRAEEKLAEDKTPAIVEKEPPFQKTNKYNGDEEYLIVFDNNPDKVWGPMRWNSERANVGLKENGITNYKFPFDITMYQKELLPLDSPRQVTDGVSLYKVEYTEQPDFNEIYQYNEGLSWVLDTGKAVGTYFIHDRTLDDVKKKSTNKIRQQKIEMNRGKTIDVTVNGLTINIDVNQNELSRLAVYKNLAAVSDTNSVLVEFNGDKYYEFSETDINDVISQVYNSYKPSVDWEKSKVESVITSTTVDTIKTIMQDV